MRFAQALGCVLGVGLLLGCTSSPRNALEPDAEDSRPNILLIVADDLGYADLGAFGSDIATPNIDALAADGLLFTQFHTAPMCAPTRAMLLSGNNNHVAGMASQSAYGLLGKPVTGYEASLSDRVAPFPRLLRDNGYATYMVGKWHLGLTPEKSPAAAGFQRSFAMLDGAGNHWDAVGFFEGGSTYWEDDRFTEWPEGRYSTDLYTEKMLAYLRESADDEKPFFAFVTYTSPHWPLQVPDEDLDLYAGHYDMGYDRLREQRFASLEAAGILAPGHRLPPRNEAITPWENLDPEAQRRESRKMELYAAMVHNLDRHVGRLIDELKKQGKYDNTVILFMSDNGAAAEDFYNKGPFVEYVRQHYNNDFDNMGKPNSFVSYDAPWAEAGSAPFSRYKTFSRQGGITAPMIVRGPGVARKGALSRSYMTVMDLAPTFLELAETPYPDDEQTVPMLGESAADHWAGEAGQVHGDDYVTVLSHRGRSLVRRGDWKLVNMTGPFMESDLQLYNLARDPGETQDLADSEPEIFAELLALWNEERRKLGIIIPTDL